MKAIAAARRCGKDPLLTFGAKSATLFRMAKKRPSKPGYGALFKAAKSASNLLVLFIPSQARDEQPINQDHWRDEALTALGKLFGGATAYPKGKGVWRDDDQGGKLLFDEPIVVQCYTSEEAIRRQAGALREFLVWMGTECRQGAVGFVIDRDYLEIRFPLTRKGG